MKAPYVAVALVVLSVAGVVFLTGVTKKPSTDKAPVETAKAEVAVEKTVEGPPFKPIEGPYWDLTSVDARIAIPKGWTLGRVRDDERLLRNESDQLDGNMNLLIMPNLFGLSIEELLSENVDELSVNPDLHLEDRRELYVSGKKVLRFDYNGTPRGGKEAVRFVAVVWRRGKKQIVLSTTVRAAKWSEVSVEVDAALETLQVRWPVARTN